MGKAPYTFPHKSRAAIVDYLNRQGRAYYGRRYPFAWNVKTYGANFDNDSLRKHYPELDPALDSAWDAGDRLGDRNDDFERWCSDAGDYVASGEWRSYTGNDQGDWQFAFAGRMGGWLVLEKWRGRDLCGRDFLTDFDDSESWPWAELVAFYRGIRCADTDFTPEKAAREVEYMAATERYFWEEEEREKRDNAAQQMADAIADSRPDLAPQYPAI